MKPIGRRSFALGVASVAACGKVAAERQENAPALADAGVTSDGAVIVVESSAPMPDCQPFPAFNVAGISNAAPARRVLYTWTTKAQADELALNRKLYTRIADENGNKGWLFDYLEKVLKDDPVARALTQPDFETGRYAWPILWPTLMAESEDYGRELVRIELAADALFVSIDSADGTSTTFQALDTNNNVVDMQTALASPQRIAGFFHAPSRDKAFCDTISAYAAGYREFHLCHESTVVEWSLRTPELLAEVDAAYDLLLSLVGACNQSLQCPKTVWSQPFPLATDLERFMSCLAFTGPRGGSPFTLNDAVQQALARLEEARFTPAPVRHRPNG